MTQFVPNKLSDCITIDNIYTIHYFKYMKDFRFTGESHNFWELVYIDAGEAEIIAGDRRFMLSQGNAAFHAPNEYHNIATNNQFANSVIVTFECDQPIMDFFVGRTVSLTEEEKALLRLIVSEGSLNFNDKLNDLYLQKMSKKEDPPFGGEQIIKNALELLLISIIRNESNSLSRSINSSTDYLNKNRIVIRIIDLMRERLYEKLTLDDIAARLSFSKSYIKRVFSDEMNVSVMQYYSQLKFEEAKRLLSDGKYSITQVADMLGFGSIQYFSRAFKQHTNTSPTDYIKSIRIDNIID